MLFRAFRRASFGAVLALIALGAFAVRLAAIYTRSTNFGFSDATYFYTQGRALAHGAWFVNGLPYLMDGHKSPSAVHPPLFSMVLGLFSFLRFESIRSQQVLTAAFIGVGTVVLVGLAGRRLASARAGLIAAAIAAISPNLWTNDRLLLSESLVALLAAAVVVAAVAYTQQRTPTRAFAIGALLALLTLTRAEGLMLFVLLAVPLVILGGSGATARTRVRDLALVAVAGALIVGPWALFNLSRFNAPTFISTNDGGVLADSYCNATFNGIKVGWWEEKCLPPARPGDESQESRRLRKQALDYVRGHTKAVPRVVALRVGRLIELYRPWQTALLDGVEGRGLAVARAGTIAWFLVMPLGIAGIIVLGARRRPVLPIVALVAVSVLTGAVFYGSPRFRVVAEVAMILSTGVALDALWSACNATRQGTRLSPVAS
jgi:4-amino-4-deoxy-L-arabinose transferase-like glycosyltransferase